MVPSRCMDGKAAPAKPGLSCKHVSRMPWVWVTAERQDTPRAQPGCCCTTRLSEAWKGQAQPPMSLGRAEPPTGRFCSLLCFLFTQQAGQLWAGSLDRMGYRLLGCPSPTPHASHGC